MQTVVEHSRMKLTRLGEHIGAEVTGIDLRRPLDEATCRRLHEAVVEHIALVIRDQVLTPEQFLAAITVFGEPMKQHNVTPLPGLPMVCALSNRQRDKTGKLVKNGAKWHTDHTNYLCPPKYTCLYAVELPESGGGTSVCNMRAAYANLPEDLKRRLDGLQTANVLVGSAVKERLNGTNAELQSQLNPAPVLQPLVRTHPENGTKALYFSPNKTENIIGLSPEDSQVLLYELLDRAVKPEFVYTHQWRLGDLFLWDNRSSVHRANFDYDPNQHRLLYRALVKGDRPR